MKIFLKQVLLIGIILVVLHACGPQGSPIEYQGKISENNDSQPPVNKNLIFQIGDNVQLGDYVVKVISFTDIATRNEPFGPEKGNKFFAIEVEYYNPTQDKQFDATITDWKIFDENGYSYESPMFIQRKEPQLRMTTINPGGRIRGWITFEIPEQSKPNKAQFQPNIMDNANVEFELK